MLIGKKFSKFYFNSFTPITKLEQTDIERGRFFYRAFTVGGAIFMGFISLRIRRSKIGYLGESAHSARENEAMINILNDAMMAIVGYFAGHCFACDYIYRHRQYVLQRLYLEQER